MQEFEVYKDINMFLRKVIFKSWHLNHENTDTTEFANQEEQEALNNLIMLLQENSDSDSEIPENLGVNNRPSNLVIKSTKMPPMSKHKWIKLFLDQVQKDLRKISWDWKGLDNLTREERHALKELQEAPNLVIKSSDKGGNIVLLSERQYEEEVMRQLRDTSTYNKLTENPFPRIIRALNEKLSFAFESNLITKKEMLYLTVREFNTPIFYIIPKLHKSLTNPPGRPIVSAIKGPLERIGKYTDTLIKELFYELPSYVRDTRDVLKAIQGVDCPSGSWLVGIDVESLYTLIPHDCGLRAVAHFLEKKYPLLAAQNEFITELLEFMLTNNCFQVLGSYFQQKRGTSMRAPWAPSYACLHLGLWEEEVVYVSSLYLSHSKLWLRYIDDIFMIWGGTPKHWKCLYKK